MSRVASALKVAGEKHPAFEGIVAHRSVPVVEKPAEDFDDPAQPGKPAVSMPARILRTVRRWLGMKSGGPVPTCSGWTRHGLKCRAPAMANGVCRMHGGSRNPLAKPSPSEKLAQATGSSRTSLVRE